MNSCLQHTNYLKRTAVVACCSVVVSGKFMESNNRVQIQVCLLSTAVRNPKQCQKCQPHKIRLAVRNAASVIVRFWFCFTFSLNHIWRHMYIWFMLSLAYCRFFLRLSYFSLGTINWYTFVCEVHFHQGCEFRLNIEKPTIVKFSSDLSSLFLQITTSAAKKLWEKGGVADMKMPTGGPLAPLQLHGGPEHQVWRDSTWSTQGEGILPAPRRSFPTHPQDTNSSAQQSAGILR